MLFSHLLKCCAFPSHEILFCSEGDKNKTLEFEWKQDFDRHTINENRRLFLNQFHSILTYAMLECNTVQIPLLDWGLLGSIAPARLQTKHSGRLFEEAANQLVSLSMLDLFPPYDICQIAKKMQVVIRYFQMKSEKMKKERKWLLKSLREAKNQSPTVVDRCPKCQKSFSSITYLDGHIFRRHPEIEDDWRRVRTMYGYQAKDRFTTEQIKGLMRKERQKTEDMFTQQIARVETRLDRLVDSQVAFTEVKKRAKPRRAKSAHGETMTSPISHHGIGLDGRHNVKELKCESTTPINIPPTRKDHQEFIMGHKKTIKHKQVRKPSPMKKEKSQLRMKHNQAKKQTTKKDSKENKAAIIGSPKKIEFEPDYTTFEQPQVITLKRVENNTLTRLPDQHSPQPPVPIKQSSANNNMSTISEQDVSKSLETDEISVPSETQGEISTTDEDSNTIKVVPYVSSDTSRESPIRKTTNWKTVKQRSIHESDEFLDSSSDNEHNLSKESNRGSINSVRGTGYGLGRFRSA